MLLGTGAQNTTAVKTKSEDEMTEKMLEDLR